MNTTAFARPEFRFASALPTAALTTITLIYGMHVLIARDYVEPETTPDRTFPVVVMEDPKPITPIYEQPQKIDDPETPPPAPTTQPDPSNQVTTGVGPEITEVVIDKGTQLHVNTGGNLVKQVMIAPVYPRRALERGIEGFVDVSYDVTAYGTTTNLAVLHAQPEGVFEKAALAAVARWKFRPQIIDEEPVPAPGQRERLRFTIEK